MSQTPKVSIIVPVYNVEKYLRQCVDSILNQTLKDIEVILVDDGSPDSCPQICDEYACKDPRVTVIHQQNGGYGKAINSGFLLSRGTYIGIIESDDWIESTMYQKLYEQAHKHKADLVKCSFFYFNTKRTPQDIPYQETNLELERITPADCIFSLQDSPLLLAYHSSIWAGLYKRSLFASVPMRETEKASYADFPFMMEILANAKRICAVHQPLVHYRQEVPGSSCSQTGSRQLVMIKHILFIQRLFTEKGLLPKYQEEFYFHIIKIALHGLNKIDISLKYKYFKLICKCFAPIIQDTTFTAKYFSSKQKELLQAIRKKDFTAALSTSFRVHSLLGLNIIREKKNGIKNYYLFGKKIYSKSISESSSNLKKKSTYSVKPLLPAFSNDFAICFSADGNYIPYFAVALQSLLTVASKENNYDIIVLTEEISNEDKLRLQNMLLEHPNISLRFYDMRQLAQKEKCSNLLAMRYITHAAYYRLFVPRIFKYYQKVLYLDCDTLFQAEPYELFHIDMGNNLIAACKDINLAHLNWKEFSSYMKKQLGFENILAYVNSGVVLFHIPNCLKVGIEEEFWRLARLNNAYYHDQNVINAACQNRILFLSQQWNYINSNLNNPTLPKDLVEDYKTCKPKILHFAWDKPWKTKQVFHGHLWWKEARCTPFYEEILFKKQIDYLRLLLFFPQTYLQYFGLKIADKIILGQKCKTLKRKKEALHRQIRHTRNILKGHRL